LLFVKKARANGARICFVAEGPDISFILSGLLEASSANMAGVG